MKTEQIKQILADAPEGATDYAKTIGQARYLKHNARREFVYHDGRTFCAFPSKSGFLKTCKSIHPLSDLREILALREENEQLKARVGELEKPVKENMRVAFISGMDVSKYEPASPNSCFSYWYNKEFINND